MRKQVACATCFFMMREDNNLSQFAGQHTAGPRPLQVIATAIAVNIQHLAAGIEAGDKAAFHGFGVELLRAQTACRNLRLIEAAGACDGQDEMLRAVGDGTQIAVGQGANRLVGKTRRLADCLPQAAVERAGEQGGGFVFRHSAAALCQPIADAALIPIGEEVQLAHQAIAASGHRAGNIKDSRAADTVLGKENLTAIFGNDFLITKNADFGIGLHALERTGIGGVGFQLHQGGVQRCAVMPQQFGKAIAVHHAAHLAACCTAGGQDHAVSGKGFTALGFHREAIAFFAQLRYYDASVQVNMRLGQGVAQYIQHTAGHVAVRIDAAALLGGSQKAQLSEELQGSAHIELRKGIVCKRFVLTVIMGGGDIIIGQITAAVACGQQLAAYTALPFQQRDMVAAFGGGQGCGHAGCAAADDKYGHSVPSSLRRVR